jgi:hypothetical protein
MARLTDFHRQQCPDITRSSSLIRSTPTGGLGTGRKALPLAPSRRWDIVVQDLDHRRLIAAGRSGRQQNRRRNERRGLGRCCGRCRLLRLRSCSRTARRLACCRRRAPGSPWRPGQMSPRGDGHVRPKRLGGRERGDDRRRPVNTKTRV